MGGKSVRAGLTRGGSIFFFPLFCSEGLGERRGRGKNKARTQKKKKKKTPHIHRHTLEPTVFCSAALVASLDTHITQPCTERR
jgi:hypothetical protein